MNKNNTILILFIIFCLLIICFFTILNSNNCSCSSSCIKCNNIEPLQNFDASFLDHKTFGEYLKTDTVDLCFNEYKIHPTFETEDFNQGELAYYDNTEISNDIKFFNNSTNILYDFQKNKRVYVDKTE